jgi:hypothetical protein
MSKNAKASLSKADQVKLKKIAEAIIGGMTLRQAVEEFKIARATLHKRLHNQLPDIDPKLYAKLQKSLTKRDRHSKAE